MVLDTPQSSRHSRTLLLPHRLPKPWQTRGEVQQTSRDGTLALQELSWGAALTWLEEEKTLGDQTAAPRTYEEVSKKMEPEPGHGGTWWENEALWARGDIRTGNEEKQAGTQVAQGRYQSPSFKPFKIQQEKALNNYLKAHN